MNTPTTVKTTDTFTATVQDTDGSMRQVKYNAHVNYFTCERCALEIRHVDSLTTGYGVRRATDGTEQKICFSCCGALDLEEMLETGRAVLYLIETDEATYHTLDTLGTRKTARVWRITNWPNTLSFRATVRIGRHNIASRRYDAWFNAPDGHVWHSVTYGDFTQIAHAKRTKERWKRH